MRYLRVQRLSRTLLGARPHWGSLAGSLVGLVSSGLMGPTKGGSPRTVAVSPNAMRKATSNRCMRMGANPTGTAGAGNRGYCQARVGGTPVENRGFTDRTG